MIKQLKQAGYKPETILWSFRPMFVKQSGGVYYSKFIKTPVGKSNLTAEIGVLINPDPYNSMGLYICHCTVGCCGQSLGIHPFSVEKIDELVGKWVAEMS